MKLSLFRRRLRRTLVSPAASALKPNYHLLNNDNNHADDDDCDNDDEKVKKKKTKIDESKSQHHNLQLQQQEQEEEEENAITTVKVGEQEKSSTSSSPTQAEISLRLLRKVDTMTFKLKDFANNDDWKEYKRGQYIVTPVQTAHGYKWMLQIFPKGDDCSSKDEEYVSCYLHHYCLPDADYRRMVLKSSSNKNFPFAKIAYRIGPAGKYKIETQICDFRIDDGKCSSCWGLENFFNRSNFVNQCLDDDGGAYVAIFFCLFLGF